MEITFDSSSPSTVSYPTPPAEYIFEAGISSDKPVKTKPWEIKLAIIFIVIAAALVIGGVFIAHSQPQTTPIIKPEIPVLPTATVINERLNVRSAPDSSKNNIITQLHRGEILTVTGAEEKGWLPVEYDGKAGFVSADLVKVNWPTVVQEKPSKNSQNSTTTTKTGTMKTNTNDSRAMYKVVTNDKSNLRLRDEPNFNGRQIASLNYGSSVQVLETGAQSVDSDGNRGNWMRVSTQNGQTGWCFGAYLVKVNE